MSSLVDEPVLVEPLAAANTAPTTNKENEKEQVKQKQESTTQPHTSSSALYLSPLLASFTTSSTKNNIYCDPVVFGVLFPSLLIPPLGIWLYEKFILPSLKENRRMEIANKKTDTTKVDPSPEPSPSPINTNKNKSTPSSDSALFAWSWDTMLAAVKSTLAFSVPTWLFESSSGSWQEQLEEVRTVVLQEKKFLAHNMFLRVFKPVAWILTLLLAYFVLVEDASFTLKDILFYSIRFYLITVASFATVAAVHSKGLVQKYKQVQRTREKELERIPMKWISIPVISSPSPASPGVISHVSGVPVSSSLPSPVASSPRPIPLSPSPSDLNAPIPETATSLAASSNTPQVMKTTALQVLKAIDSLSKSQKASILERRLVWIGLLCIIRGVIGAYSGYSGGSKVFTSLLYGIFHIMIGFLFYSLLAILEFELHEDDTRWSIFTAIISQEKCKKLQVPFYIPLASLGRSQNIVGWYSIRGFLKDLKGKFDFARMEVSLGCIILQMISIALAGVWHSYFYLGLHAAEVYDLVIGANFLVAWDMFLCLLMVLEMFKEAVSINTSISSHVKLLLDEELNRSFALSALDLGSGGGKTTELGSGGMSRGVISDSIHQIKSLREKLTQAKESDKMTLLGVKLDESIVTWIRGALVSYGLVFGQSLFARKVLTAKEPKLFK